MRLCLHPKHSLKRREQWRRYSDSPKGKARILKYRKTAKRKAAYTKYNGSEQRHWRRKSLSRGLKILAGKI